ncbi:hypothetical protein FBHYGVHD_CDS0074 [Staphylococcus phage MVC_VPHSA1]|uniref:Uncharacterized protein n=1 Tax=Staphylococcus phage MVC_VPHSA1 TaxID=3088876 RepID=A0ABZ0QZN7_9CAUD|nr:hypothetical protein FBHYGVHD_CDS0074 [Staphylococcus phage MVC_VPHSA1]
MEKKNCLGCRHSSAYKKDFKGETVRCLLAETLFGTDKNGERRVKVLPESQCGQWEQSSDTRDVPVDNKFFHCPACHYTGALLLPHQVMGALQDEVDVDDIVYDMEVEGTIQTCPLCDGEGTLDELAD